MAEPFKPNSGDGTPQNSAKSFAEEISAADADALLTFLHDPRLDDEHLCILLARKRFAGDFSR